MFQRRRSLREYSRPVVWRKPAILDIDQRSEPPLDRISDISKLPLQLPTGKPIRERNLNQLRQFLAALVSCRPCRKPLSSRPLSHRLGCGRRRSL